MEENQNQNEITNRKKKSYNAQSLRILGLVYLLYKHHNYVFIIDKPKKKSSKLLTRININRIYDFRMNCLFDIESIPTKKESKYKLHHQMCLVMNILIEELSKQGYKFYFSRTGFLNRKNGKKKNTFPKIVSMTIPETEIEFKEEYSDYLQKKESNQSNQLIEIDQDNNSDETEMEIENVDEIDNEIEIELIQSNEIEKSAQSKQKEQIEEIQQEINTNEIEIETGNEIEKEIQIETSNQEFTSLQQSKQFSSNLLENIFGTQCHSLLMTLINSQSHSTDSFIIFTSLPLSSQQFSFISMK